MGSLLVSTTFIPPCSFTPRRQRSRQLFPERSRRCISRLRVPHTVMQRPESPIAAPRPVVNAPRSKLKRPERYSSSEWAKSLLSLPHSRILKRVYPRILPNILVAAVVSLAYPQLSLSIPGIGHVSPLPHTFLATAMSLLLVLRTTVAYDRYWEGRTVWGRLINVSRAMARTANEAMPRRDARVAGALIVSYAHALHHHLQGRREREPFERLCKDVPVPSAWPRPASVQGGAVSPMLVGGGVEGAVASAFAAASESVPRGKEWEASAHSAMAAPPRLPAVINDAANKPLEVVVQLGKAVQLSMEHKGMFCVALAFCLKMLLVPAPGNVFLFRLD